MNLLVVLFVSLYLQVDGVIPRPKCSQFSGEFTGLSPNVEFLNSYEYCYILQSAQQRFIQRVRGWHPTKLSMISNTLVKKISIEIADGCDEQKKKMWPSKLMNETYTITIGKGMIEIDAKQVWGVMSALETLQQEIYKNEVGQLMLPVGEITDEPNFLHRGFLIDTGRHFISVSKIIEFVDAMAMVKMNVLHWHMTDDESFPVDLKMFRKFAIMGSFGKIYSERDQQMVSEHARLRGIRVMAEINTPGHTASLGKGEPGLLTECFDGETPTNTRGPIDPTQDLPYNILSQLLIDLYELFMENLFHLGGDDVPYECWASNPQVMKFMSEMGFGTDFSKLQIYYTNRLLKTINDKMLIERTMTPVLSQDLFEHGFRPNGTVVFHLTSHNWKDILPQVTAAGYPAIVSSCWMLDYIEYNQDWRNFYDCDLRGFDGTPEQHTLVIGGEAMMWGEFVDDTNIFSRSWPRGAIPAERLWSEEVEPIEEFANRLAELRCRMKKRGLEAEPVTGPGFCSD